MEVKSIFYQRGYVDKTPIEINGGLLNLKNGKFHSHVVYCYNTKTQTMSPICEMTSGVVDNGDNTYDLQLEFLIDAVATEMSENSYKAYDVPDDVFEYADIYCERLNETRPDGNKTSFKKMVLEHLKQRQVDAFAKTTTPERQDELLAKTKEDIARINERFAQYEAAKTQSTDKKQELLSLFEAQND